MSIKILHIIWSGHTGGGERFLRDVALYSNKKGFEHSICFLSERGVFADQIASIGTKTYCLGMKNGFSILSGIKLLSLVARTRPNIVTIHSRNYLTPVLLSAFPDIKKVCFEHGGKMDGKVSSKERKLYRYFYNYLVCSYNLILTNSNYMKSKIIEISGINPGKIKVFYYGIDPDLYRNKSIKVELKARLNIPKCHRVFGIIGRLAEQKGVDDFVKIASEIKKLYDKCSFLVIGEGPMRPVLEQKAAESEADIRFLGDRQDVPALLSLFDIYIFTSRWEPFGIVALEALASKVPIVGFKIPGMKEIIEKGGGGILIDERNNRKIAKIAIEVLEDKEMYNKLSNEGCLNVQKNFDVRERIKVLEQEYNLLLGNKD